MVEQNPDSIHLVEGLAAVLLGLCIVNNDDTDPSTKCVQWLLSCRVCVVVVAVIASCGVAVAGVVACVVFLLCLMSALPHQCLRMQPGLNPFITCLAPLTGSRAALRGVVQHRVKLDVYARLVERMLRSEVLSRAAQVGPHAYRFHAS